MCGLFGVMPCGTLSRSKKNQLRQLVLWLGAVNDDRGGHSYGVWGRDTRTVKGLGYFIHNMQSLQKLVKSWRADGGSWLAGHTRYATHGAKTVANAHPFEYKNLTLAHNGVLSVYGKIDGKVPEVDSNELAKYLSQQLLANPDNTFEEVFKKVMEDTTGSIGLLMSDELGNLRAYASMQELHIAEASWGYAISSSKSHLITALDAAGLEYNKITEVKEDYLVAPWYSGIEDCYAPAWSYTYTPYSAKTTSNKTWADFKREAEERTMPSFPTDTLDTYNREYTDRYPTYDRAKSAAESAQVFAGFPEGTETITVLDGLSTRPGDWEGFTEPDPLAAAPCQLCSDRPIGAEPAVWTDPDSGKVYLICTDCAEMFESIHGIDIDPLTMEDELNRMDQERMFV